MSVGYFDGRTFIPPQEGEKTPDIIYTTSYGLECDKIAKKRNGSDKLPFWDTPAEMLTKIKDKFIELKGPKYNRLIGPSRQLISSYQKIPSKENEAKIKDQIQDLKEKFPELIDEFKELCLIVDECDSVLYDHADSRIQSTIPLPHAQNITDIGKYIAQHVTTFYETNPKSQTPTQFKETVISNIKKVIHNKDSFLKEYIEGEVESWVDDALKVMNPEESEWQDGVKYLKSPSISSEIKELFKLFRDDAYHQLPEKIQTKLTTTISNGLDLYERLNKHIRDDNIEALITGFITYMPQLLEVIREPDVLRALSDPKYKLFIDKLADLYTKSRQIDRKINEQPPPTPQQLKEMLLNDNIRYIEEGTSQIIENMKFSGLVQLFLEYKEYKGKTVYTPTTALDLQSQLDVISSAHCVVGFTGSLPNKDQHSEEHDHLQRLIEQI